MKERRKRQRSAWSPYYVGFTDRRQPEGVVVTWDRTVGGELIRTRRDLAHLARVLVAKRGPSPDEQAEPTALPFGTLEWADAPPRRPRLSRRWPSRLRLWRYRLHRARVGAWA